MHIYCPNFPATEQEDTAGKQQVPGRTRGNALLGDVEFADDAQRPAIGDTHFQSNSSPGQVVHGAASLSPGRSWPSGSFVLMFRGSLSAETHLSFLVSDSCLLAVNTCAPAPLQTLTLPAAPPRLEGLPSDGRAPRGSGGTAITQAGARQRRNLSSHWPGGPLCLRPRHAMRHTASLAHSRSSESTGCSMASPPLRTFIARKGALIRCLE